MEFSFDNRTISYDFEFLENVPNIEDFITQLKEDSKNFQIVLITNKSGDDLRIISKFMKTHEINKIIKKVLFIKTTKKYVLEQFKKDALIKHYDGSDQTEFDKLMKDHKISKEQIEKYNKKQENILGKPNPITLEDLRELNIPGNDFKKKLKGQDSDDESSDFEDEEKSSSSSSSENSEEFGSDLDEDYKPIGLYNTGVICFSNALVECLFNLDKFRKMVINKKSPVGLSKIFNIMTKYIKKEDDFVSETDTYNGENYRKIAHESIEICSLNPKIQEDSAQLLNMLLGQFDNDLNNKFKFGIETKILIQVKCDESIIIEDLNKSRINEEFIISLPIKKKTIMQNIESFQEIFLDNECNEKSRYQFLKNYNEETDLALKDEITNKLKNHIGCEVHTPDGLTIIKEDISVEDINNICPHLKYKFISTPDFQNKNLIGDLSKLVLNYSNDYIIVQLKRFSFSNSGQITSKNTNNVKIDEIITIENNEYHLNSFVRHEGSTIKNGHYVAYVFRNGIWYLCDNTNVTITDLRIKNGYIISQSEEETNKINKNGYLFFYEKL